MNEPATPGLVGSSEGLGLRPERSDVLAQLRLRILREHGGLGDGWRDHWNLTPGDSLMHREAVAEIERLRAVVKAANDQAERFERGWYLRGDVLASDQLGAVAEKRDNRCKLTECQGKPRCATCVALDAAYPPSPPPQTFGIIDPDYARVFTQARIIAWQYGYACLAHGSFTRDLDLLLVPWTDAAQADDVDYFAPRIAEAAGLKVSPHPPSVRMHGRKTWTLLFSGFADARWVDLSVLTPPAKPQPPRTIVAHPGNVYDD